MKLILEPHDGVGPLLSAFKSAKKSVDIVIFRFDRKDIELALKATAERGVKVTALIAHKNRGGEKGLRRLELSFLEAGITVARSADALIRYHDKFIVIDERILYVLSFNFTHLDIDRSRGFGIVTRNSRLVKEAIKLFHTDATRTTFTPGTESIVVSPENSRKVLSAFLKRAKRQLLIYDPKISDTEILEILQNRAKAGVEVRIIGKVSGRAQFSSRQVSGMRLHTRTIIRDNNQAFVGSQSLRLVELDSRRELGLILKDAKIVKRLHETFESDWKAAQSKEERVDTNDSRISKDAPPIAEELELERDHEDAEKAVQTLVKELDPLTTTVKKAVRKAVAKVGDDVLKDSVVKDTMKKVVKKAVKTAVKEAVEESARNTSAT